MNRLVLRYAYPITAAVLLIFVWVISRRLTQGADAIVPLAVACLVAWPVATLAFISFWPRITVAGFKRAILSRGFGGGPIPVNTLYAVPDRPSASASSGGLMATGTDDLVYIAGWIETRSGPLILDVPGMDRRYYSLQFTDPASGGNFAYVGTRTTGSGPRRFLICGRSRPRTVPEAATVIDVPHGSALVIGRVFAADDDDRLTAYALAQQIQLRSADAVGVS